MGLSQSSKADGCELGGPAGDPSSETQAPGWGWGCISRSHLPAGPCALLSLLGEKSIFSSISQKGIGNPGSSGSGTSGLVSLPGLGGQGWPHVPSLCEPRVGPSTHGSLFPYKHHGDPEGLP